MFKTMLVCLALVAQHAAAVPFATATNGEDWIQLTNEPCQLSLPHKMPKEMRASLLRAESYVGQEHFEACWDFNNDSIRVFYEDGDMGMIPKDDFSNKKIM